MDIKIFSSFKYLISYIKLHFKFSKNEKFLLFCKSKSKNIKKYKKSNNPKISLISPVHNSDKFLLRFLKSIQSQNFPDIEIIFIDDYSIDNSIKIIEKYKKQDNRIILIKNKKNNGTFLNRNIGVLYSKGKYLILPDPDDILSNNILSLSYKYAEKYKYEIIKFNIYTGKRILFNKFEKSLKDKKINQPDLSTYIFYGLNELEVIDCCVCNKFFKRETYIKALNTLNNYYLKMYNIFSEDSLINYIIHRIAKSFYFVKEIGYYYVKNYLSVTNNLFGQSRLRMKCFFLFLKIIYEYSKNTKYEKDMSNLILSNFIKNNNINVKFSLFDSSYKIDFFYNIVKMSLNSKFFTNENKFILENWKYFIKISKLL